MIKNYFEKPIRKRFIDAFPKFKANDGENVSYFWEVWVASPFYNSDIDELDIKKAYDYLLASFYNWHFVYADDLGIAYNTMKTINEYYPNVLERLKIVNSIREMSIEEFKKSGLSINSAGSNPKIATQMDDLIDLVDSQTANFQLKSAEQALKSKFNSLYDGIMDDFISRFKYMFVKLYNGITDYIYLNEQEEDI